MRATLILCAAIAVPAAARAQFTNPGFEDGTLNGWTLGFTSGGTTTLQQVVTHDIDGPGPLTDSLAGQFSVGRAPGVSTGEQGITLTQVLALDAGTTYRFEFDWSATRTVTSSNSQGGIFAMTVDGVELTRQAAGATSSTNPHYGHVFADYVPPATANYTVGVAILRPFTVPSPVTLFQSVDNFSAAAPVPEPSLLLLVGTAAVGLNRRGVKRMISGKEK